MGKEGKGRAGSGGAPSAAPLPPPRPGHPGGAPPARSRLCSQGEAHSCRQGRGRAGSVPLGLFSIFFYFKLSSRSHACFLSSASRARSSPAAQAEPPKLSGTPPTPFAFLLFTFSSLHNTPSSHRTSWTCKADSPKQAQTGVRYHVQHISYFCHK